ncbi:MAG: class I SAM-dependent methyltransferase [Candidatus Omnitrophica bacterium]|nr:class I SAM-dependent methyltransferase [Candidatus Omnitrophota bacterium]
MADLIFSIKTLVTIVSSALRHKALSFLGRAVRSPYMKYEQILAVKGILKDQKPGRCLEWGSGFSTLSFSSLLGQGGTWLSMEHDKSWAETVVQMNKDSRVKVKCVVPNHLPWSDEHGDGTYEDMKDYVEAPSAQKPFDLILVDGRARVACLKKAYEIMADDGVVILHDAERPYYQDAVRIFPFSFFLESTDGCKLWVGSKKKDVSGAFRLDRWQKIFSLAGRISRSFAFR